MNNFKIFSFFSGSGFLDLGFELAGFPIQLVNEFSPSFIGAYRYAREQMGLRPPTYGYSNMDINEYLGSKALELAHQIEESRKSGGLVGFLGGPPCPDFSVAGKQRGREGDNGKLSLSYINLIIQQKPDFFLFENVKGLWRTAKHRAFYEELKNNLEDAGYRLTDRLTNALEFGAPQDRDRILLFGIRKKYLKRDLELADVFPWTKHIKYSMDELKKIPWPTEEPFALDSVKPCPDAIPKELTVEYWFEKNQVDKHPNGRDCFIPRAGAARMATVAEGDDSKKSYKRLHRWRYSPTVAYGNNEVHLHPYKARRLTVAEALSLQSLPKEFALPPDMSLTDKFKTTGNGVPFLLANGIANTVFDFLSGDEVDAQNYSI
ncbi:MAG TPA: DNA cytosine methyltransferase [Candidatus Enterenecus faecium]|uniref:DNA (cytosine-5-)-methyltransferase n=1 Tax=Candidatus Enterenecus faecium TaxID=2840780 RepID=A0A9D0YR11_9FIRM|nr:DNA cytosine methyltransferase [Candidatus Enterenecus faecium]